MASIVLANAAAIVGGAVGGPIGAAIGYGIGSYIGSQVDLALFSNNRAINSVGMRLADLSVQTSTYGKTIANLYGTCRIAGNIIWAANIIEHSSTTEIDQGKGASTVSHTDYSYSATFAVALCEGPIDAIYRIWADTELIIADNFVVYKGCEEQLPDPTIECHYGVGNVPAYRGLAYVVIKDFPLGPYGNRIPNFTFEVKRTVRIKGSDNQRSLEENIKSMVLIPGSGEFVYDTIVQSKICGVMVGEEWAQQGPISIINMNNHSAKPDCIVALDQLADACPNLEWIAPVVTWFGNDIDADKCVIKPGVEYQQGATTSPDLWQVNDFDRFSAHQISLDKDGSPAYGGTVNDTSVIRLLDELKRRKLNIMFYPMFFMDTAGKPWRGRVTGSAEDVEHFFNKAYGYNDFIIHYAKLVKGRVDAFLIGSELIGLTRVRDQYNNFPAVDQLVQLAIQVKSILGENVKVSYAADWSEYHHTDGGWYNLDKLWSNPAIDFIGIDAYFPLTDNMQNTYDENEIIAGWQQGEGFDYYYNGNQKLPLAPAYAWKNITWWWENEHINPDGVKTDWQACSKKIWFTELGFPSVDCAANSPNIFYDPNSSEGGFPKYSRGEIDFHSQRVNLNASLKKWSSSPMVENIFIWTWDARPFPTWPESKEIWRDGNLWAYGHWVNGKIGLTGLAAIITDLCLKAGLTLANIDVSRINQLVDGYVLTSPQTVRNALELLQQAYFFYAVESDGIIKFIPYNHGDEITISKQDIATIDNEAPLIIKRHDELTLPARINLTYIDKFTDYQQGMQIESRANSNKQELQNINLPIILNEGQAKNIAVHILYNYWRSRNSFEFALPLKYLYLEPGDKVRLITDESDYNISIRTMTIGSNKLITVKAVSTDVSLYKEQHFNFANSKTNILNPPSLTKFELLDLPLTTIDQKDGLYIAATGIGKRWQGAAIYLSHDDGFSYRKVATINQPSTIGKVIGRLSDGPLNIYDYTNVIEVVLEGGTLENISELALLNGSNLALIGQELIQFQYAELIEPYRYKLHKLLRGRLGTEKFITQHNCGDKFILINSQLKKIPIVQELIGVMLKIKVVTIASLNQNVLEHETYYQANYLKPLAPCHINAELLVNGDIEFCWKRRSRSLMRWQDYYDMPLLEQQELYEIEIINLGGEVIRTIISSTAQIKYTKLQQLEDFGLIPDKLMVKIYQISAEIGRGWEASFFYAPLT